MTHARLATLVEPISVLAKTPALVQEHPVVRAESLGLPLAIYKMHECGLSEVFGYRVANLLGPLVPPHVAVWTPTVTDFAGVRSEAGSVGLLVHYFEDWQPISREEAADRDPSITGRAFALNVFDRQEWGEFGLAGNRVYFIDLEYVLPALDAAFLLAATLPEREQYWHASADWHAAAIETFATSAAEEAERLRVGGEFRDAIAQLAVLKGDDWRVALGIDPHPLGRFVVPRVAQWTCACVQRTRELFR